MSEKTVRISGIKYNVKYKIGQGQQGSVFCIQNHKGELFALKRMDIINQDFRERMYRQITLHHSCQCDNIIKFIDSEEINGELYIILELGECNLSTYLQTKQGKTLDQPQLLMLIKDISKGLMEVHRNQIMHRDIKADNIILKDNRFKISDFGVSGEGAAKKTFIGTPIYLAPEVLNNKYSNNNYNYLVDVWALGLIAFQTYFGVHPFYYNPKDRHQMNFDTLQRNMNMIIDGKGFHIQKFINKLKNQGFGQKALEIQTKIRKTSAQTMGVLRIFWDKVLTLDPSNRINAQTVHKMFNTSGRTTFFQNDYPIQTNTSNDMFQNKHQNTWGGFSTNQPGPQLHKTQSFNHQTQQNKAISRQPSLNIKNVYKNNINNEEDIEVNKINLSEVQRFIQNSKMMVLQLSTYFNQVMNIRQIQFLNISLVALQMAKIQYTSSGSLHQEEMDKFKKMTKSERQKTISQSLRQASKTFRELIQKYPHHHFVAQTIFRLQFIAILHKCLRKFQKITTTLPLLYPMKSGFLQIQQNIGKILTSNLGYFCELLKKI